MPMINTKLKFQIFIHKVDVLSPEGHNISEGISESLPILTVAVSLDGDAGRNDHSRIKRPPGDILLVNLFVLFLLLPF